MRRLEELWRDVRNIADSCGRLSRTAPRPEEIKVKKWFQTYTYLEIS